MPHKCEIVGLPLYYWREFYLIRHGLVLLGGVLEPGDGRVKTIRLPLIKTIKSN